MSFIQMTCISSYFLTHARTYIYCLYLKCMNQISIVSKSLKSRNQNGLQGCQTNVLNQSIPGFHFVCLPGQSYLEQVYPCRFEGGRAVSSCQTHEWLFVCSL